MREPEPSTFSSSGGPRYEISFSVEPLLNLRRGVMSAQRIQPVVFHTARGQAIPTRDFGELPDELVQAVDRAALDYAAWVFSRPGRQPPLILPHSFRTLGGRRGRGALTSHPHLPPELVRTDVILEIIDVERGTPQGRLLELTGLIGHVCRGVFVRVQPVKGCVEPVKGVRLQGLTFDAADFAGKDADLAGALLRVGEEAQGLTTALIAQGLPAEGFVDVACVAGFSHAAMRPRPEKKPLEVLYVA